MQISVHALDRIRERAATPGLTYTSAKELMPPAIRDAIAAGERLVCWPGLKLDLICDAGTIITALHSHPRNRHRIDIDDPLLPRERRLVARTSRATLEDREDLAALCGAQARGWV